MERRGAWIWRLAGSAAAVAAFWLRYPPDWHNTQWLAYDAVALVVVGSFAGSLVERCVRRRWRTGDVTRAVVLVLVMLLGWLFQEQGWLSPHVLCAWTLGLLEVGDRDNPRSVRAAFFAPTVMVVVLRATWPGHPMTPLDLYVLGALASGTFIGGLGLLVIRRRMAREARQA